MPRAKILSLEVNIISGVGLMTKELSSLLRPIIFAPDSFLISGSCIDFPSKQFAVSEQCMLF